MSPAQLYSVKLNKVNRSSILQVIIWPVKSQERPSNISDLKITLVSVEYRFTNAPQYLCLGLQDKPKMGYVGRTVAMFERECESDQEEEVMLRKPRTRKRSSTSWNSLLLLRPTTKQASQPHAGFEVNQQRVCLFQMHTGWIVFRKGHWGLYVVCLTS